MKDILISVIIPAYNEEEAIESVLTKIHTTFIAKNYNYEIIVVDDASTDKTSEIAGLNKAIVIKKKTTKGPGSARKAGILKARGSIIAMIDADGSYDAAEFPSLIEQIDTYDMINGVRDKEMGTFKYLRAPTKFFIKKLAEFLSGYKIPDLNTGMKVFKKDIILNYLWVIPDGFSCVTTMTLAFLCNDHSVGFVPIKYYTRIGKSKFQPIKDTAKYLSTVLRMAIYFNPLKFFTYLSLSLFFLGIVKTLYDYFFAVGKMQASDIVLILSSFLFLIIGTLAELIISGAKQISYISEQKNK